MQDSLDGLSLANLQICEEGMYRRVISDSRATLSKVCYWVLFLHGHIIGNNIECSSGCKRNGSLKIEKMEQ